MNAVRCHLDDDNFPKFRLLPQDPTGQRFLQYFHHGWSFIEADLPPWDERPQWRTETRYPLQPRNLWSKYQDDQTLLGLSFASQTNYLLLDIDRTGANHPAKNRRRFDGILAAMESIGLCHPIAVRSSESEGIHLYYFLSQPVHSFTLAATVRHALEQAGYKMRDGQLEIFPNPKPYNVGKPTSFKSHRLPLQRGSCLLDWDFHPGSDSITTLLQQADCTAAGQDLETLLAAMEQVWHTLKKQYRRGKGNVQEWYNHLTEQIREGFSGYGQTNTLLLSTACFGIVFRKLGGDELYEYVLDSIINSPNYYQYCRHQHEIDMRVAEVVRSAQQYYYPYPGKPPRDITYQEHFGGSGESERGKIIIFPHPSQKRHQQTLERVTAVIALLKSAGQFPVTAYQRTQAIIAKSQEAFGVGVSQTTLHKAKYLPLWHPAHEQIGETAPTIERVNPDSTVLKYPILPSPWDVDDEAPKPLAVSVPHHLHVPPLYEGFLYLLAPAGDESEESAAFEGQDQPQAVSLPEEGNLQNPSLGVNSSDLTILQPLSQSDTIDSSVFNSSSDKASSDSSPSISTDKNSQYPLLPAAHLEKPQILDNKILSIAETPTDTGVGHFYPNASPSDSPTDSNTAINPEINVQGISIPLSTPPSTPQPPDALLPDIALQQQQSVAAHSPLENGTVDSADFSPKDSPPVISVSSSPETAEDTGASVDSSQPLATYTPEQYREAIRLKLQATSKAKHWARMYCQMEGICLMPPQREQLEQCVRHHLMQRSPLPILQQEAAAWFSAHPDIASQIGALGVSWMYIQNLQ